MSYPEEYLDGDYSRPVEQGAPREKYPFRGNNDRNSIILEQDFWQTDATFRPEAMATRHPEIRDVYLISESDRMRILGDVVQFTRKHARVPTPQVTYGSEVINKPAFPTNDYNSAWVDSTSSTATANIWSAALAATVSLYPGGGTFTLTYVANFGAGISSTTAALNWNDSNATIKAALEALASSIADSNTYTVTGSVASGSLSVARAGGASWNGSQFTTNSASLTPASISSVEGSSELAVMRYARTSINFQRTNHGLTAAQAIRPNTTTTGGGTATTVATVPDADNFTVANADTTPDAWAYYRTLLRTYTPGVDRVVARITDTFYLPGITPGITTPADIPTPDVAINDTQLLTLITNSATGFQTYDADPLARWPDPLSPIYVQSITAINVDNL
jgi:hypothetical protein